MHGFGEPAGTNMLKVACHSFRQWAATLITSIGNARATLSWLPVAAWLLSQSAGAIAQTNNSYPMIMSIRPVAVPVGQTTECEVAARYNLHGAYKVLVSGDGVTGEVVPVEKPAEDKPGAKPNVPKIKVRFTVAADAVPGVRDVRVATPQGASTVGQLVVVHDPVVTETGDNNSADKAQPITVPATVCGAIEAAEDRDCFKFHVEAGTAWSFHVRAQRIEDRIHDLQEHVDPILTLRNMAGSTLATSDNYYAADPLLLHRFEQAGDYWLEIRDVRFKGNSDWVYCIEINDRPFITQLRPLVVAPGVEHHLTPVGWSVPAGATVNVTVPADAPTGIRLIAPQVEGRAANAVAVVVSRTSVTLAESVATQVTPMPATAPASVPVPGGSGSAPMLAGQRIILPTTVGGCIEKPGAIDRFSFEAKAGEKFTFNVIARRVGSALDSVLRLLNSQGGVISEVDDAQFNRVSVADSMIENWAAPADGTYFIEIRDLHQHGGPEFTYALEITRSSPHFLLELDTDKTLLAPGTLAPLYVRVIRKNGFMGEVQLAVDGLPPGVAATCGQVLATGQDGCIILHAAADAPAGATNIRVSGTAKHTVKEGEVIELAATAQPLQELYFPGGGRGHYPVAMHTVSVADPMDIRAVKLSTTDVMLKPGESQRIDVSIERAPGFKGNVTLDVLYQHLEQHYGTSLPKGVTLEVPSSKTLLTGEESVGHVTLKAAPDAPAVEKQLIPVMAHVSVNFVMKITYCGAPVYVTVGQ